MIQGSTKISRYFHLKPIFLLIIIASAIPATADWDPSLGFRTIRTAHFRVHYYTGEEAVAQRVAALAEPVLKKVSDFLHLPRPEIIHILVTDTTDSANGSARVFPYPLVVVQPSPPQSFGQLSSFDDYLRVLLTHELTHVVHMNTKRGLPAFIDKIFGNLIFPNYAHPALLMEGLAVLSESRLNKGGRLYSPYFEMVLRAERRAHAIPSLSKVTMAPTRLPRGASPYLFGSYFMDYLARKYSVKAISDYFKAYGGLLIPFAHNIMARRVFHRSLVDLYRDYLADLRARLDRAIAQIKKQGLTRLTSITKNGEFHAYPIEIPSGIYFVENDAKSRGQITRVDARGHRSRLITCFGGCGGLRWSDNLNGILTTHAVPYKNIMSYSDIFLVHTDGTETRVTRGARAFSPADFGKDIVAVQSKAGESAITVFDFYGKKVRTIVDYGVFDSISDLSVHNKTVYFSATIHGNWDIYSWSGSKGITRVTTGPWIDIMPEITARGDALYYISTRNGVYNVYKMNLSGPRKACQITNITGGVFHARPARAGLIATVYSNRGFDIARIKIPEKMTCYPVKVPQRFVSGAKKSPVPLKSGAYNPFWSMRPHFMRPIFTIAGSRVSSIGLSTQMQDATNRHIFDAQVETDTRKPFPDFRLAYTFGGWWANIGVYGGMSRAFYVARPNRHRLVVDGKYGSVGMFIGLPLRFRDHRLGIRLSVSAEFNRPDAIRGQVYDPMFTPVFARNSTSISTRLGLNYSSLAFYPYSVAPQDGWVSGFGARLRTRPDTGGWSLTFSGYASAFITPVWAKTHSIELSLYGGASRGDERLRGLFSLGGPVTVNPLDALVNQAALPASLMRGFTPGSLVGDTFWAGTFQYNLPLVRIDRGIGSLPLYFRYLAGDVFVDTGSSFFQGDTPGPPKWSVGAEVWLTLAPALLDNFRILLGFAYAERPVVYFTVGY